MLEWRSQARMWAPCTMHACMHGDTWYNSGESKSTPTNAPTHHSVHKMGCVFSSGFSPCVNQCWTTINLFGLLALTFLVLAVLFSQPSSPSCYPLT
jgi:hypothetical protein